MFGALIKKMAKNYLGLISWFLTQGKPSFLEGNCSSILARCFAVNRWGVCKQGRAGMFGVSCCCQGNGACVGPCHNCCCGCGCKLSSASEKIVVRLDMNSWLLRLIAAKGFCHHVTLKFKHNL